MSWDKGFDEPVPLPNGKLAYTLRDAGQYVLKLSEKDRAHERWQTAAEALTLVVEHRGPSMFARMAVMSALTKDRAPTAPSERKDKTWGRQPLRRER